MLENYLKFWFISLTWVRINKDLSKHRYHLLTLPNIGGYNVPPIRKSSISSLRKCFWWQIFFTFHIHISNTFWPNFMNVSLQLLKLWLFFKDRCSQNDDFMVKILYEWQILEMAVKCEQRKICTWNFVRTLIFIKVLRLQGKLLQFLLFSLSFYCSTFFSNNRTIECQ